MKGISFGCLALVGLAGAVSAAPAPSDLRGYAPVSVSSANYRQTPRSELLELVEGKTVVNPPPRPVAPLAAPQHFVFLPGEIFEADLSYEQVCGLLTPSLATKGFVNAADSMGLIREQGKVTLVLRVSFGVRPWRLPAVRTEQLAWRDGLEARPTGRGLSTLGGERIFEHRAGGNDQALAAAADNAGNTASIWGGGGSAGGSAAAGPSSLSDLAVPGNVVGYESTRDFNLIVVDAFSYAELKEKGRSAQRLWTTFVAAPREPRQPFSAVARTLVRQATPAWGESLRGLQVVTDARAEVKIGEATVVPE